MKNAEYNKNTQENFSKNSNGNAINEKDALIISNPNDELLDIAQKITTILDDLILEEDCETGSVHFSVLKSYVNYNSWSFFLSNNSFIFCYFGYFWI